VNVPAVLNVWVKVPPTAIVPEFTEPSSKVTVCAAESLLVQTTVWPLFIVVEDGNDILSIDTSTFALVEGGVVTGVGVGVGAGVGVGVTDVLFVAGALLLFNKTTPTIPITATTTTIIITITEFFINEFKKYYL